MPKEISSRQRIKDSQDAILDMIDGRWVKTTARSPYCIGTACKVVSVDKDANTACVKFKDGSIATLKPNQVELPSDLFDLIGLWMQETD